MISISPTSTRLFAVFVAVSAFAAGSALAQSTVFSETFSVDGPITGSAVQNGSGIWNSNLSASGGSLQLASNGFLNINVAALPASISTLQFDLVNAAASNGEIVMVSLGGERETAPDWGQIGNNSNDSQFFVWTKDNFAEFGRNGWGNFGAFGGYPSISGTTATFTVTIDRSAAVPTVSLALNGTPIGTPQSFSSQSLFTGADAISFAFTDAVTGGSIDNISLTVIPEPSSFAALAGLGALGLVGSRRRRR